MTTETKFKQTEIGMIPEDWEVKNSEEVMEIITDYVANGSFASLKKNVKYDYEQGYAVLIRLVDYNNGFKNNFVYISKESYDFLKKSKLFPGDIIISNVGAYAGTVFRAPILNKPMSLGPNAIMMRSLYSTDFYYYWFVSIYGNESIKSIITGSAQPKFNKTDFRKLDVPVPLLNEQSAIAKILSDLDSKIELLQKQNETLEKIGQAIFKQWFVDFEFPNEEGKPYKSSGGKMVDSELGEIPEGWSVGKLGGFIEVQKGLSYKGKFLSQDEKDIPLINLGTIAPHKGYRKEGIKYYTGEHKERHLVKPGDIVIANTDITQKRDVLGSPAIVPDFGSEEIIFTHHIYAVRNEKFPELFLYYLFQNDSYKERAITFATGTTVLALPKEAILDYEFVVPQEEIFNMFGKFAKDIFKRIILNTKSIKSLEKTRNLLLPKLMTGKIRVPLEVEE